MTTCIGIDPGWRWTGAVLCVDERPVNGMTLGPVDVDGLLAINALDRIDKVALDLYTRHIGEHIDKLYDQAVGLGQRPLVAIELPTPPEGTKQFTVTLRAFLITWTVAWAMNSRYDADYLIPFDKRIPGGAHGVRHQRSFGGNGNPADYYPTELCRRRPHGWGRCDEPDNARSHERSGFDLAQRAVKDHEARALAVSS